MGKTTLGPILALVLALGVAPTPTPHPSAQLTCEQLGERAVTKGNQAEDELIYLTGDAFNYDTAEYAHYRGKADRDIAEFHRMKAEFERRCK